MTYLQNGGNDRMILANLQDLLTEAQLIEQKEKRARSIWKKKNKSRLHLLFMAAYWNQVLCMNLRLILGGTRSGWLTIHAYGSAAITAVSIDSSASIIYDSHSSQWTDARCSHSVSVSGSLFHQKSSYSIELFISFLPLHVIRHIWRQFFLWPSYGINV